MGDLVTRLRLDSSQHNSELEKAKGKVSDYKQEADKASDSLGKMSDKQTRSAKELLEAMSKMEGSTRSTSNYRQQLAAITKQIQDLTINYRSMNDEMKSSDFGREVAAKIDELTAKASQYKDTIMDAQSSITALASDTAMWDGVAQGIDAVSASLQAIVSTGVLGQKSTDKLVQVIAKLKAIETATNAVIKVGNAIQTTSKLLTTVRIVQTKALTKAKNLEAAATGKATVAQKLFNTVAKANPYVLLASAVLGLVGALAIFSKSSKEAEKSAENQVESLKEAKTEASAYQKSLASTTGDILGKYRMLQIQYSKLKDEHEKAQWIKNNANEFENLGLKIRNVNDAERDFVTNADNVVESLKVRARAVANQQRLVDLYKDLIEAEIQADEDYNARKAVLSNEAISILDKLNKGESVDPKRAKWAQDMAKHVEDFNAKLKGNIYKTTDDIKKNIDTTTAELEGSLDMSNLTGKGSGGTIKPVVEDPVIPGSLRAAQQEVSNIEKRLSNLKWDDPSIDTEKRKLEEAKAEVERIQSLLSNTKPLELDYEEGSLAEASHFVSVFQRNLESLKPNTDGYNEVLELLNIWKTRQEEIKKEMGETDDETKSIVDKYQEIVSKANDINLQFKIGAIDKESAESQIKDLNKQLKDDLNLTATVKLDVEAPDLKVQLKDNFSDSVKGIDSTIRAFDSLSSAIDRLESVQKEGGSVWEEFMAKYEIGVSIINTIKSSIESFQSAMQLINTLTALSIPLKEKESEVSAQNALSKTAEATATELSAKAKKDEAKASAENTVANEAEKGSVLKTAIAKMMEAIAGGAKAVSSLGPIGPILAVAAAAAITAALISSFSKAKSQKFSTGGIYNGKSSVGDKGWARLNDGEMVLNTRQQKKLFEMLNSSGIIDNKSGDSRSSGLENVQFEIEGTKLVGVLGNYNRKINHAR